MPARSYKTALLEAGLVVAWSSGFIGAKLAADTESVFLVLFWRFAIVSVVLAPVILTTLSQLTIRSVVFQAMLGTFAMFGYLALGVKSIDMGVPVGTAALISALQPLATAALAAPLLNETVRLRQWLGLVIGLGGVAMAVWGTLGTAPLVAYGLSFAATLSLVAGTLLAKRFETSMNLMPAIGIQSTITALLFVPLAAYDGSLLPPIDRSFAAAVAWFILFSTIAAYGLYWLCLRNSTATHVGSLIYLTPPTTMIWGWAMFGEPLTSAAVGGLVICFAGVMLAKAPGKPNE